MTYVCSNPGCGETVEGEHVFNHTYVARITTPATCKQAGVKTLTCSCGDTKTEVIESAPDLHVWNEGVTEGSRKTYTCTEFECGATKSVVIASGNTADSLVSDDLASSGVEFEDATLDVSGLTGQNGTLSGATDVSLSAGKLSPEDEETEKNKLTAEQKAQIGDKPIYSFNMSVGGNPVHEFEGGLVTITIPYELADGEDVDSIAIWYIDADGEVVSIEARYANGFVTFETSHFSYYTVTRLTPAERCALYGHSNVTQAVVGDCLRDSYELTMCVRCHASEKVITNYADGHDYSDVTTPATCTTNGSVVSTCADCGHSYSTRLNATGHAWEVVDSQTASCTVNGFSTYSCENCDEEYTEIYEKLPHVYTDTTVNPTCEDAGYVLHDCNNCDYTYEDNYVAATGHAYAVSGWSWTSDNSAATLTLVCGNNAQHTVTLNASIAVTVVNGTCSSFTRTTYTASVSYNGEAYTDEKTVEVGTPSHTYSTEWSYNDTEHWHQCVCGAKNDVASHSFGEGTVTKAPTCIEKGQRTATCACGKTHVTEVDTVSHNYVDGVCSTCGRSQSDVYFLNLISSWKSITGVAVVINDFSYEMTYDAEEVRGNVQLLDFTALELYVEDGEICGKGTGKCSIFNGPYTDETAICDFDAIISDGYLYLTAGYGMEDVTGEAIAIKASAEGLLASAIDEILDEADLGNAEIESMTLFSEKVLPILRTFVEINEDKIEGSLSSLFNIIFTLTPQTDGTYVLTLDFDKISALNENLATKSIAELIDVYFGEGTFDGIVEFALEILNLTFSEIPAYVDSKGLDSADIIESINEFAIYTGAPEDFDVEELINSERFANVTVGMLMFDADDAAQYEQFINEQVVAMLRETTVYSMLVGINSAPTPAPNPGDEIIMGPPTPVLPPVEIPDNTFNGTDVRPGMLSDTQELEDGGAVNRIKEAIQSIIDMLADKVQLSFVTDGDGTLTDMRVVLDEFEFTQHGVGIVANVDISIDINGRIDADLDSIVGEVAGEIVLPTDDMLDLEADEHGIHRVYYDRAYGSVKYNGEWYHYDSGVEFRAYRYRTDVLDLVMYTDNCDGWKYYEVEYARDVYRFTLCSLFVDSEEKMLLIDEINGVVVELVQSESGYTVIFEDGSTKTVTVDMTDVVSVERVYLDLYFGIFENPEAKLEHLAYHRHYYYNASTQQYADSNQHEYEREYELLGDSCTDGVIEIITCKNCDYRAEHTRSYHENYQIFALLDSHAPRCAHHYVNVYGCACGYYFNIDIDYSSYNFDSATGRYTCPDCDLVIERLVDETENGCSVTENVTLNVILSGTTLYTYTSEIIYPAHNFEITETTEENGEITVEYACTACGEEKSFDILMADVEYVGDSRFEYYYDYYFTPDADGVYTITSLGEIDTYVTLFVLDNGALREITRDDDNGYNANFLITYELTGGNTYVYRIGTYGYDEDRSIMFALSEGSWNAAEDSTCRHDNGMTTFIHLPESSASCGDGVIFGNLCALCGYVSANMQNDHYVYDVEAIDLRESGACYGEFVYSTCACGEETQIYLYDTCAHNVTDNEYYDDDGRFVHVESRSCSNCGLRYDCSHYTVADIENCIETSYYTVMITVGSTLVLDAEYEVARKVHDIVTEATLEGDSCEEGVRLTYSCRNCDYEYSNYYTHHYSYNKETIDLSELGSECGGFARVYGCACGYQMHLEMDEVLCDFSTSHILPWVNGYISEDRQYTVNGYQYFGYEAYIATCAVTDPTACAYKIRYASYWLKDPNSCTANHYITWQLGYDETTGTCQREISVINDSRTYHDYDLIETDDESLRSVSYECPDCQSYYRERWYYSNGTTTKYEVTASNTTGDGSSKYYEHIVEYATAPDGSTYNARDYYKWIYSDDNEYWYENLNTRETYTADFGDSGYKNTTSYTNSDGERRTEENAWVNYKGYRFEIYDYESRDGYWYRYDYTYTFDGECIQTVTYTDSEGENRTDSRNICRNYNHYTIIHATCTQDGLEGRRCEVCEAVTDGYVVSPTDHAWVEINENRYFCYTCGLENENGASGSVIMEDLTDAYGEDVNYVVGYYAYNGVEFTYYVSLILEDETEIVLNGVEFTELSEVRAISFSKAEVEALAAAAGYTDSEAYDVRFAFVPYGADGSFDYAITFADSTVDTDTIVSDISFIAYVGEGELATYTIAPTEDGEWNFTSFADADTYGYIYDSEGNQLYYDDDSGRDFNFSISCYLEAGETYTLRVRWYNSQNAGNMAIVITRVSAE